MYTPLDELRKETRLLVTDIIPGFDIIEILGGPVIFGQHTIGVEVSFGLVYRRFNALVATWDHTLLIDPYVGMGDEEIELIELSGKALALMYSAHRVTVRELEAQFHFPPRVGAAFMESCRLAGYDDDEKGERELAWFTDHAARRLEGVPKTRPWNPID